MADQKISQANNRRELGDELCTSVDAPVVLTLTPDPHTGKMGLFVGVRPDPSKAQQLGTLFDIEGGEALIQGLRERIELMRQGFTGVTN